MTDIEKNNIEIRNERPEDYARVEEITRLAFYNMYMPGCVEHYLLHIMREHPDFIKDLDFVMELDGEIIGNIVYTKAKLTDDEGNEKEILTFGPVCVLPEYQRRGYGKNLMEHSFEKARELGYDIIVIFGSPANYVARGFVGCRKLNVSAAGGKFPAPMLVKELVPAALDGRHWTYTDSPVMSMDVKEAEAYDDSLPPLEKKHTPSQEEFAILSKAFVEE